MKPEDSEYMFKFCQFLFSTQAIETKPICTKQVHDRETHYRPKRAKRRDRDISIVGVKERKGA